MTAVNEDAGDTVLTQDSLLDGAVRLSQKRNGYRAAIDPVLLAAAVPAVRSGGRVLDLGTGTGAALLCYLHRNVGAEGIGVELDADVAAIARMNADNNDLTDRMTIINTDIGSLSAICDGGAPFDQVFTNPPYLDASSADANANADKARSTIEGRLTMSDWIKTGLGQLRHKGGFTIVQRADRLDAILAALHGRAGDVEVIPLWPRAGVAAKRVIVRARKGVRGGAAMLPGLVLHGDGQSYTAAAEGVLRRGESFP